MNPREAGAYFELGKSCRGQGRLPEAEAALKKALELDPENAWVRLELGTLYLDQDKLLEAAAEFEKVIAMDRSNSGAHCQLGRISHRQGQWPKAEASLRKALELDPQNGGALMELGALYQEQGRFSEAAAEFGRAIAIDLDNGSAHGQLGRIYRRQGRSFEAEAALLKALKLDPQDCGTRMELGALYENQAKFLEAAAEFGRAIADTPHDVGAHLCLGHIHLCLGQWAEAKVEFQKATDLDSRNDRGYLGLWASYRGQARSVEAAAALAKAVAINPRSALACTELLGCLDRARAVGDLAVGDGSCAGLNDRSAPGRFGPTASGAPLRPDMVRDSSKEQMRERVFCLLPWTHLYIFTDGSSSPCCMWSGPSLGNVRSSSIAELWNSPGLKALRSDMMSGRPVAGCWRCYEDERSGSWSLRQARTINLGRHQGRERLTAPDGTLPQLPVPLLEIRFSNICNLRCRTCDPTKSSAWAADAEALGLPVGHGSIQKPYDDWDSFWRQLQTLLEEGVEEIVFAGGEPLIMEEHYRILDFLIARGLTDVRLSYVTNFSTLRFQDRDVIGLWSCFRDVRVSASLDGSGRRGEYLRKGLSWEAVVANRKEMLRRCPEVSFSIPVTLSIFNALHLPDFHREWVEKGYVNRNKFTLSMLVAPAIYRVQVLPAALKQRVLESYRRHRESFLDADGVAAHDFTAAARFIEAQDCSELLPGFVAMTRRLDQLRGEDCREVFPELAGLFEAAA